MENKKSPCDGANNWIVKLKRIRLKGYVCIFCDLLGWAFLYVIYMYANGLISKNLFIFLFIPMFAIIMASAFLRVR